jgi:glycosyltransferase involved in cell wall biosynthesis
LFPPCPDIERFFQVADLHLFLSHREGFGNVAIEAAAVGVPTFGFDVVGVRDSVIRGATGELFPFRDITAVEAGVRAAIADPKQFKGRFSGARDAVAERFSQSTIWNTYAAIFLNGE